MEKITMQQAIEKGYTHFIEDGGERLIKFESIKPEDIEHFKESKFYIVDMQNPYYFTIHEDTIRDLISDYITGQDEVADNNDNLFNIVNDYDYSKLAHELNLKFSNHKYYKPLDIEIIF